MNRFLESAQLSAEKEFRRNGAGTGGWEDVCVCVCVCVWERECIRDTYGAALSRSVKPEWTPGPRLALIAFLSTSSCCIRVTFPLWGDVPSFIYLFILFSIPAQMHRLHPHSHFTEVVLQGSLQKLPKCSCRGLAAMERRGEFQQTISYQCSPSHTDTHTHLWLCFTFRQCIMEPPLFVRLFHYLPPPLSHPPGPSDAIYHPWETLRPLQLENLMNK